MSKFQEELRRTEDEVFTAEDKSLKWTWAIPRASYLALTVWSALVLRV